MKHGGFFRGVKYIAGELFGDEHICGEELIALASTFSIAIADNKSIGELMSLIEFFGLVRHNLELIKHRRILNKIEQKIEKDK